MSSLAYYMTLGSAPDILPGAVFDLDPRYGVTLTNSKVSAITDQSGGLVGTQGTDAARPTLSTNAAGLQTLVFAGAQFLSFGNVLNMGTNSRTVYAVGNINAINATFIAKSVAAGTNNRWALIYDSSLVAVYQDTAAAHATGPGYGSARHSITSRIDRNAKTNAVYRQGAKLLQVAITQDASYNHSSTFRLLLGAYNNATDTGELAGYFHNGTIDRILIYNEAHTDAQIAQMHTALKALYNLP